MGKKEKSKSLKKLQEELLELVKEKLYGKDEQVTKCVDSINKKYKENWEKAQQKKAKQLFEQDKIQKTLVDISLATLQFCDKLIIKEKVSNQIMGYTILEELVTAEKEIKKAMSEHLKD